MSEMARRVLAAMGWRVEQRREMQKHVPPIEAQDSVVVVMEDDDATP